MTDEAQPHLSESHVQTDAAPLAQESTATDAPALEPKDPPKRRRGRPRKNPIPDTNTTTPPVDAEPRSDKSSVHAAAEVPDLPDTSATDDAKAAAAAPPKRRRGRPRKVREAEAPSSTAHADQLQLQLENTASPVSSVVTPVNTAVDTPADTPADTVSDIPADTPAEANSSATELASASELTAEDRPVRRTRRHRTTLQKGGQTASEQGKDLEKGQTKEPITSGQIQASQAFESGQSGKDAPAPKAASTSSQQVTTKNNASRRRHPENLTEPSVSKDALSEMKIADLRIKAQELGLDYTGLKKADLVQAVYLACARAEGFRSVEGVLEIGQENFGMVRTGNYMEGDNDAYVPQHLIKSLGLRPGDYLVGTARPGKSNGKYPAKYPAMSQISSVNGLSPEEIKNRPRFRDLTPIFPDERLTMEWGKLSLTGRAIDLVSPIGKGQRGLIVSPPKAGKTTVLKHICQSIAKNNPEVHLFCLLVDERPEEVTDMQRSVKGTVVASTFDMPAENHTRVAELVIERAKRLVELGGDVVVVLDSITRLSRAYNLAQPPSGRVLSGGVDSAALYPPKKFLGAARNIEFGGSLTIIASALIDTGSKMDEVIFEEFKGTGNMELKLDRDLADKRIFPAIDPVASGTRNENLLLDPELQPLVWGIRRVLANLNNTERAANALINGLKETETNTEFLIRSAKKAQAGRFIS